MCDCQCKKVRTITETECVQEKDCSGPALAGAIIGGLIGGVIAGPGGLVLGAVIGGGAAANSCEKEDN